MPLKKFLVFLVLLLVIFSISKHTYAAFKIPEWILKTDSGSVVSNESRIDACKRISDSVKDKTKIFATNKDIHIKNYNKAEQSFRVIANDLSTRDLDVTQFRKDIDKFAILIDEYTALYDQILSLLVVSNEDVCTEDGQGLRVELQYAKDQLISLVRKRHEIRLFYKEVIRKDIVDLRNDFSKLEGNENE